MIEEISSTFGHSAHKAAKLKEIILNISDKDSKVAAIKRFVPTR